MQPTIPQASACRRMHNRHKFNASMVTCWSPCDPVATVPAIETDTCGARLMLPWNVQTGESLIVSVGDELGFYHTQVARVAWTERLELTGKVIAGVEFQDEIQLAV